MLHSHTIISIGLVDNIYCILPLTSTQADNPILTMIENLTVISPNALQNIKMNGPSVHFETNS